MLRFLANRGLREVGAELGVSEEAARKRVSRALERLRAVLQSRGITATSVLQVGHGSQICVVIGIEQQVSALIIKSHLI